MLVWAAVAVTGLIPSEAPRGLAFLLVFFAAISLFAMLYAVLLSPRVAAALRGRRSLVLLPFLAASLPLVAGAASVAGGGRLGHSALGLVELGLIALAGALVTVLGRRLAPGVQAGAGWRLAGVSWIVLVGMVGD